MTALWITLAAIGVLLLSLLLLLLVGNAKLRITCNQKVTVVISVFGFSFRLFPRKQEQEEAASRNLARCRNPERVLRKELRRQRREIAKACKKKQKAAKKAARKQAKKEQKKALASTQPKPNLIDNLSMISALIQKLYEMTHGKLKVRVRKMHISVATGDAAKTAILYGAVLQSASYLLQLIQTHFIEIERKPGAMEIFADYLSDRSHVDIDLVFRIRLIRAARIAIGVLRAYDCEKDLALAKAKQREELKKAEAEAKQRKKKEK